MRRVSVLAVMHTSSGRQWYVALKLDGIDYVTELANVVCRKTELGEYEPQNYTVSCGRIVGFGCDLPNFLAEDCESLRSNSNSVMVGYPIFGNDGKFVAGVCAEEYMPLDDYDDFVNKHLEYSKMFYLLRSCHQGLDVEVNR